MIGPIFVLNSRVPIVLEKVAPITISAITLGPFVFCRDAFISDRLKKHEATHWRQQVELLIVGFFVLYILFWLWNLCRGESGLDAYRKIPFEVEARRSETVNGPWFGWIKDIYERS